MALRFCTIVFAVLNASVCYGEEPSPVRKVEPRLILDNRYAAAVRSIDISADGKLIAAAGDSGSLNVWDAASGKVLLRPLNFTAEDISEHHSVVYSPNGKLLVIGDIYSTIRFWDVSKLQVVGTLKKCGRSGVFSPDGKSFVSACGLDGVKVWGVVTRKELAPLKAPTDDKVTCIAYAPNGQFLVFGTEEGKLYGRLTKAFDKPPFLILQHTKSKRSPNNEIAFVTISHDSNLIVSIGKNGIINVWDTNGKKLCKLSGKQCVVTADSRFLLVPHRDGITVYDAVAGKMRAEVEADFSGMHIITISPDGRMLAAGYDDGTVRVWDVKNILAGIR